jgi:RNA polymerase sigma-70 factor (ECF subfamily)
MSETSYEGQSEVDSYVLIQRLQAGDVDAFETLFERYNSRIYRQAMHLLGNEGEAEEVMQEVFLTLYEKAYMFRGEAAVSTWLYRLTANAAIGRLRRHSRRQEISLAAYLPQFRDDGHHRERPVVDWSDDLERAMLREESSHLLREAIDKLRPLDKAVVVLCDLEELPQRETAEILSLSLSAVKARLHRARLILRGQLAASLGYATPNKLP